MRNDLANVPPMGWNSWNTFFDTYDESLIMEMADILVSEGYLDCGYQYLILDDCWLEKDRDPSGRLVPSDPDFPMVSSLSSDISMTKV